MNSSRLLSALVLAALVAAGIYYTTRGTEPQVSPEATAPAAPAEAPAEGASGMSGMDGMSGMTGMEGMSGMEGMAGAGASPDCVQYNWDGKAWNCTKTADAPAN